MPDKMKAENLFNSLVDTFAEVSSKQKSTSFIEEDKSDSVKHKFKRLFGRQKPVHNLLGGGKSADVLLWRNKKISASVMSAATSVWALFEWFDYQPLSLVCFALIFSMLAQFVWSNASGLLNRSSSEVPRLVLPDDLFVNIAIKIGSELNRALGILQDIACEGNFKQLLVAIVSLWSTAVIGSWCDFLTVLYTGFVAAHTLPVLYEKYEDEVDDLVYKVLDLLQQHYQKLDAGVLSRIPKGKRKGKKRD